MKHIILTLLSVVVLSGGCASLNKQCGQGLGFSYSERYFNISTVVEGSAAHAAGLLPGGVIDVERSKGFPPDTSKVGEKVELVVRYPSSTKVFVMTTREYCGELLFEQDFYEGWGR